MRSKLMGFAPDLDPATQGAILDMTNIIPSFKGMKSAPSPSSAGIAALSAEANSLAVCVMLDGTRRTFAGTASGIYEAATSTWTDRTAVGGYSIGSDQRWSFAQFGDVTIAAAKAETMQASTDTGNDFAAIASGIKASFIDVSEGFVMAVDTNDGTYGDQSDRWWCSAYLDYTDWSPAVSTQCTTGRLVSAPGPIRGIKAFGSGFVANKDKAIYVASYIGPPIVFSWQQIPGDIGCPSHNSIVNLGHSHAFIGFDDVYLFDGSVPHPIGGPIREWLFDNYDAAKAFRTIGTFDFKNGNIWWWFCSKSNDGYNPDEAIVYNIRSQKWGRYSMTICALREFYGGSTTYHDMGTLYTNWDDLPTDISYDSPIWTANNPEIAVIKEDEILYELIGTPGNTQMTLYSVGDPDQFTTMRGLRPRFLTEPPSSSLDYYYDDTHGDNFVFKTSATYTDARYQWLWSSRWHRVIMKFGGEMEIIDVTFDIVPDGTE